MHPKGAAETRGAYNMLLLIRTKKRNLLCTALGLVALVLLSGSVLATLPALLASSFVGINPQEVFAANTILVASGVFLGGCVALAVRRRRKPETAIDGNVDEFGRLKEGGGVGLSF